MEHYHQQMELNATVDAVYKALTMGIAMWWTQEFEGTAATVGDVFTVRFGEAVHKTMEVTELIPNAKVVWLVKDSRIAIPELKNQSEWIGTTITWELHDGGELTKLDLTHIGLHPEIECYDICSSGWQQFTNSLRAYVETGKGTPFLKQVVMREG